MDLGSIENKMRHVKDVRRIESELRQLSPEEIDHSLSEKITQASVRWEACLKSFALLFMMLNRGNSNKMPDDRFDVRLKHEIYDNAEYDTYVRVWRDKRNKTYHVKPYLDLGSDIIDAQYETESFGGEYQYSYGTHHSKFATIEIEHDGAMAHMRLDRVDGRRVDHLGNKEKALFIAAIEGAVMPKLDDTEDSLAMITSAILDEELNPELARRARLPDH